MYWEQLPYSPLTPSTELDCSLSYRQKNVMRIINTGSVIEHLLRAGYVN